MTETTTEGAPQDVKNDADSSANTGLAGLKLAQLKALASQLGIAGSSRMRKSDLVEAISAHQRGGAVADRDKKQEKPAEQTKSAAENNGTAATTDAADRSTAAQDEPKSNQSNEDAQPESEAQPKGESQPKGEAQPKGSNRHRRSRGKGEEGRGGRDNAASGTDSSSSGGEGRDRGDNQRHQRGDKKQSHQSSQSDSQDHRKDQESFGRDNDSDNEQDEDRNDRRNRRRNRNDRNRRGRDRNRGPEHDDSDFTEDDQLIPIAGILDVLDNYAFVRTSGYLPGQNDVYVSLQQVKKNNLRKGDVVTGFIKAPQDNPKQNKRQKFAALVKVDKVNGRPAEANTDRVDFNKLTPLYPQERLRLEGDPKDLGTRVIDLVAPIGKGQRGLIVSPPKAGKTIILQALAKAIKANNPEVHLMMVLVDERPEEVTDMQRTVDGEVIASTFDRPADDHTTVAELAIERAKRLVEVGKDVVVLLDSMTRLGRAYNTAAPASGRILSGGVDANALYPPKRFFGAARNIENGGSLTILATALVETGSKMDEVIFEEFKGTGNMELRLSRRLADKRIFPAISVSESSTRREENLLSPQEVQIMWKLRRVLSGLEQEQGLDLLLKKIKETSSNAEFLLLTQKTTLGGNGD
ncbi:transcription termination factor Rho [Nesterenkonia natronophila]|uniref:transcription termination factor Rho n=1 Tax=Nesterenkonia natronophila TaxID=2174932 RepID=UPI001CEF6D9E|nr:transcription termination factor Rho [Nesterenkonia natronophila]